MTSLQKPISRPIVFKQTAAPNPLLALLGDDDDGDDEISAFGRARVVNLDDTREWNRDLVAAARGGAAAAAAPAFQMSPPKPRKQVAAAPTVAPVARKLAPVAAAAPAQPLGERVANGQNFSKNSSSPALRKVSESLDKLRSELHAVRAQKELAERTTKIEPLVDDEPTETRRIVQDFSDDEHVAADATERIDEEVEDEDDDDIVVSLPTVAPAAVAPKTPSAADMRARARAIDAAVVNTKSPAPMSLEQRVAALERELAEEREARRALERKIAHLLK